MAHFHLFFFISFFYIGSEYLKKIRASWHDDPAMIALVQDWLRQYVSQVDLDMFAFPGTNLITVCPAHAKFNDVCQLLLDLQTLVLVAAPLHQALQKVLVFAVFPSSTVSSQSSASNHAQHSPVS